MFDESIEDIPSAAAPLDKLLCCDVCLRKDDKFILAQIYCMICKKKFCTPHEKVTCISLRTKHDISFLYEGSGCTDLIFRTTELSSLSE